VVRKSEQGGKQFAQVRKQLAGTRENTRMNTAAIVMRIFFLS
jgi:hypothetical protein